MKHLLFSMFMLVSVCCMGQMRIYIPPKCDTFKVRGENVFVPVDSNLSSESMIFAYWLAQLQKQADFLERMHWNDVRLCNLVYEKAQRMQDKYDSLIELFKRYTTPSPQDPLPHEPMQDAYVGANTTIYTDHLPFASVHRDSASHAYAKLLEQWGMGTEKNFGIQSADSGYRYDSSCTCWIDTTPQSPKEVPAGGYNCIPRGHKLHTRFWRWRHLKFRKPRDTTPSYYY